MDRFALSWLLLWLTTLTIAAQQPYASPSNWDTDVASDVLHPRMARILEASEPAAPRLVKRRFRLSGGHEFNWLQPRFSNNVSAVVTRPSGDRALSFDHEYETTSRIFIAGENHCGNGLRARYWYLETDAPKQVNFATASASPLSLTIAGAGGNLSRTAFAYSGDALTSTYHLQMRTIDIEGTHRDRYACTEALWAFGLRYAKIHQRAHAVATDPGGALTELVCQDVDFEGFGPTLSGEFTRQWWQMCFLQSRFSWFANARTSLLLGEQQQDIVLVTAGGASLAEDEHRQDDLLPIIELAGGLQWTSQPFRRATWIVRGGYRAETWFGVGGPVDADSNLGLHGVLLTLAMRF